MKTFHVNPLLAFGSCSLYLAHSLPLYFTPLCPPHTAFSSSAASLLHLIRQFRYASLRLDGCGKWARKGCMQYAKNISEYMFHGIEKEILLCGVVVFFFFGFFAWIGSQYKHDFHIVRNKISQSMILIDKVFRLRANFTIFLFLMLMLFYLANEKTYISKHCFVDSGIFCCFFEIEIEALPIGSGNVSNGSNLAMEMQFGICLLSYIYLAFELNLQLKTENAQNCNTTCM